MDKKEKKQRKEFLSPINVHVFLFIGISDKAGLIGRIQ